MARNLSVPSEFFREQSRLAEVIADGPLDLDSAALRAKLESYVPRYSDNWEGGRQADGIRVGWGASDRGTPGLIVKNPLTGRHILYVVGARTQTPFELVIVRPGQER